MRTPSQTVGPYFSLGLSRRAQNELPGGTVRLAGRVLDGEGAPVEDAVVELWEPRAGFARAGTGAAGEFSFLVPPEPRRLEVMVFARGLLKPVVTRLYLPGAAGAEDESMVAREDVGGLRFDVRLQGDGETAFFDF
jgi:protocatechuate 3,4-dioxygenase, alpha subunit